jgi:formate hydrogenlyase transcriptional activator
MKENKREQPAAQTRHPHMDNAAPTGLVGKSLALRKVLTLIGTVAETNSTVLLQGESGTGKELVANAIHAASLRSGCKMIKINCGAIPKNLIESELFGHEKGAFTGAVERRTGKFEQAHGSTLFLDEIGDLQVDLQVKLLRALQEKEIERVGGRSTLQVDVRVIAATNKDLEAEVAAGNFRSDLFYRLNVFPITLPPLRQRKDDIPILIQHFLKLFSQKLGKNVSTVSNAALQKMLHYSWPGNIREMEHLMERTILLTKGGSIHTVQLPTTAKATKKEKKGEVGIMSLAENEKAYILYVLGKTNGKVRGPGGAAELLKLPSSTLQSKMKKLGIRKSARY